MYYLVSLPSDRHPQYWQDRLQAELSALMTGVHMDPLGQLFVRDGSAFILAPWSKPDELIYPPLLFVDESYDRERGIVVYGGLAFVPLRMVLLILIHYQNLLDLGKTFPKLWPAQQPPPRLHLKDYGPHARAKTFWSHLPGEVLNGLWAMCARQLPSCLAAPAFLSPVKTPMVDGAIRKAFPGQDHSQSIPDLTLQIVAGQFKISLFHTLQPNIELEVVVDYDQTRLKVGSQNRQATLRLVELLLQPHKELVAPKLKCDLTSRPSSRFPQDCTLERLVSGGYAVRPLVESLGLQLVDLYLGTWRQITYTGKSTLGLKIDDLGTPKVNEVTWLT